VIRIEGQILEHQFESTPTADVVLVACGYESRSRALAERFEFPSAIRVAIIFDAHRILAFDENVETLRKRGFELVEHTDNSLCDAVVTLVSNVPQRPGQPVRVFVDISSQSRSRMAAIIEGLMLASENRPLQVIFGYSPAAFVEPRTDVVPNVAIGPVSPFFAGWARDPDLPVSLILGLGYEPDRALGAVEYLEPSDVVALFPHSHESAYDQALRSANDQLIQQIGVRQVIGYEVEDPNATLALLASTIANLRRRSSVLILPSGPKILVLLSLLLACIDRDVAVWRVSAGVDEPPIDRKPTGEVLMLECLLTP
jgi:hypothetical protein